MFQENQKRLTSYLNAGLGACCLGVTADAAIVTFSNSGSFIEGTVDNGDEPTHSITLPDTSVLKIDPGSYPRYLQLRLDAGAKFTGTGGFENDYSSVSLLDFGDAIFANSFSSFYPETALLVADGKPQPDFTGNVSGYIGFITGFGNKGWLKVAFNSTTGLFSYDGGAVATAGEELTAGQTVAAVPEPASVLGTLGLLAGGMFVRRRRLAA